MDNIAEPFQYDSYQPNMVCDYIFPSGFALNGIRYQLIDTEAEVSN